MLLALSDPGTVLIAIGTCAGTLAAAWLAYKRELISRAQTVIAPAAQSANDAKQAADKAQNTADAFVSVIIDLQKRINACMAEASAGREENRHLAQSHAEAQDEIKRLRGVIEGILSDHRRDTHA